jgi:hypothetical protein
MLTNMAQSSARAKKALAPAAVQKRIQEVIAVHCLNWVYQLDAMKLAQFYSKVFASYHGSADADVVSFTTQCLSGEGVFSALWDIKEDASGVNTLVLKTSSF